MAYSSSGSSRGGEGPAGGGTGTSYGRYHHHHNEAAYRYGGGDGDRMGSLLGYASDPSAGAAYGVSSLAYHQQQQQQQQMELALSAGFGSDLSHLESSIAMGLKRPLDNVFPSVDDLSKRSRVENVYNLPVYPQRPGEKDCVFYMKTRSCKFGLSCRFDHPTWVPAGGIPDWKEAVPSKTESLPLRPDEPDCVFYMKYGSCKFGETCKFNHPNDRLALKTDIEAASEQNRTEEEMMRGEREEDMILKPANAFNSKGFPIRPGESDCTFYMQMGSCKYGSTCRFNHPEIAGLSSPGVPGSNTFGGLMGSLGAWPGSLTNCLGQQYLGYTPDFGLLGLNTAAFGGLLNMPSYPQRPGEQECSFYMKTGVCKFGAGCRFHHPVNRSEASSHSESNFASSGLPRREGETVCSFYLKTGVCKYGATCKFDHPPPSEVAAKVLEDAKKAVDQKKRD